MKEGEDQYNWANWRQKTADVIRPRDVDNLVSQLDLPESLALKSVPGAQKDGSSSYAIYVTETNDGIVTFTLGAFYNDSQMPLLKKAVHDALERAKQTETPQIASFVDPNRE